MAHVRATRVPVLIHQPLELGRVRVSCADILGLQMLQLTVNVVAFAHVSKLNFLAISLLSDRWSIAPCIFPTIISSQKSLYYRLCLLQKELAEKFFTHVQYVSPERRVSLDLSYREKN